MWFRAAVEFRVISGEMVVEIILFDDVGERRGVEREEEKTNKQTNKQTKSKTKQTNKQTKSWNIANARRQGLVTTLSIVSQSVG